MCGFSTSRTILLAAAHGHIVPLPFGSGRIEHLLCQRAPTNSKRDSQNSSFIIHQFIIGSLRYPTNNTRARGCFYATSEISSSQKVLCRSIVGPISLKRLRSHESDQIVDYLLRLAVFSLLKVTLNCSALCKFT